MSGDKVGVKMTANKTNFTKNFNRMFKVPINMQEIKEITKVLKKMATKYTVSYTHLDVYKRQDVPLLNRQTDKC